MRLAWREIPYPLRVSNWKQRNETMIRQDKEANKCLNRVGVCFSTLYEIVGSNC
jgi:hypothetical protein